MRKTTTSLSCAAALALLAAHAYAQAQETTLAPGETWAGEIGATSARVDAGSVPVRELVPTRGVRIALELAAGKEATLHLRSLEFDAYVVVLDEAGELLAENDDGDGTNALVHFSAEREREPASAYLCAMHGETGAFEVALEAGRSRIRDFTAKQAYEHGLTHALARLEHLATEGRSHSTAAALALCMQGRMLARLERFDEGAAALERSVALLEELEGPEHPLLVKVLNSLAVLWLNRGEEGRARPLLERAVELGTALLPERHALMASMLSNLAAVLNRGVPNGEGVALQRRALEVAEEVYGPRSLDTSVMRTNLGVSLARLDRFDEAEEAYLAALEGFESLGDEHPATLRCLNNLVRLETRRDRVDEANAWLTRVLEALERSDRAGTLSHADALDRLSRLRVQQGRYHDALEACGEALATRERIQGPRSSTVLTLRIRLAGLLRICRRTAEATVVLDALTADVDGAFDPLGTLQADILIRRARNARAKGDLAQSIRLLEEGLELRGSLFGVDSTACAAVLLSLAVDHRLLGDFTRGEECVRKAFEIYRARLGNDHEDTLRALIQLAIIERQLGRHVDARAHLDELLAVLSTKERDPYLEMLVHNAAGSLAFEERRFDDAIVHFRRAIEVVPDHATGARISAASLGNLGNALREHGEVEEALVTLRSAKEVAELYSWQELPWIQSCLVVALLVAGRDEEAWSESLATMRRVEQTQDGTLRELLEHERHHFLSALRAQLDQHLMLAGDRPERATEALDAVLRWKGRVARSLRRSRTDLFDELDPEAAAAVVELRALREQLSDLFWTPQKGDRERHRARMEELRRSVRVYERELLGDAAPDSVIGAGTAELRRTISDGEALVVFFTHAPWEIVDSHHMFRAPARVQAWVVRPSGTSRVDLGESAELRKVLQPYLESLRGLRGVRPGVEDRKDPARIVHERLWAPLEPHLEGVADLIVSPDGFLNLLPFGPILDAQGQYLLERFSISITDDPLGRLVQPPAASATPSLVVVGGVDYDLPADDSSTNAPAAKSDRRTRVRDYWAPLPHTADEMQSVLALHRSTFGEDATRSGLTGQQASEAAVRDALSTANVVHLATHGFFDPAPIGTASTDGRIEFLPIAPRVQEDSPGVLAGLVLAGANARESSARGNGLLTAEELAWLDLRSADLVVLSACETALGKPWPGEGMASLRSALHSAGVRTVVSSLWAVPDQETAELMESFYHGLWVDGVPPGEALRRAQLEALSRSRLAGRGPRPGTWGAFLVSGAGR